jgi:hypothetical protein
MPLNAKTLKTNGLSGQKGFRILFIFFHPDSTVGCRITLHLSLDLLGTRGLFFTAGREFHPALKMGTIIAI